MRYINFGAGPSMLPESVLLRAQKEMLSWGNTGMSPMEVGHRSTAFEEFFVNVQKKLRNIFSVPENYEILLLPGGGQGQFAAVPMNLLGNKKTADYFHTGVWSGLAIEEAKKYCQVNVAVSSEASKFFSVPDRATWKFNKEAAYLYYCPNETITGLYIKDVPDVDVPVVADMTSCLGSVPFDVSRYGVVFSSAQKNLGQAGVTVIFVRKDLLKQALPIVPSIFNYTKQAENSSRVNTPPTYAIYILDLMLDWMQEQGGLTAFEKINQRKAKMLYDYIDQSDFYHNHIDHHYRSMMNVTFTLPSEDHTAKFIAGAKDKGLVGLKGHKKLGGIRASLYNPISEAMVAKLLEFMKDFAK